VENGPEKAKNEKEGEEGKVGRAENGPKEGGREGVCFFKTFLNNFSNLFLNQTFYIFSQPFSQIILKTFKSTQQQNSCIST
jgi:hypothetical protein